MLMELWNLLKRVLGLDGAWEVMTLSRAAVHPASARALTRVLQPAHTIRLRPEPGQEEAREATVEITWHGITDQGVTRPQNEDSLMMTDISGDALFVVADGMGGHDAGEVASAIAAATVAAAVRSAQGRKRDPLATVEQAVQRANAAVRQEASSRRSNMGTTLTAALVSAGTAYIASVGDSRAYWIENGSISQVTRDHSLVAALVAAGKLTPEEARDHPKANLLVRTIGSDETVKVDTFTLPLRRGGTLLLCTDGLWGEVPDEDLRRICADEQRTEVVCARLVQQANDRGGRDNITAIVAKVD